MTKFLFFVTTSMFYTGCYCVLDSKSRTLTGISKFSLHYNIYDFRSDGTPFNLITKVDVLYDNGYYLYKIPYMYQLRQDTVILLEEERYQAFVIKSGSSKGYLFNKENDTAKSEFILKDSVLRDKGITGLDFYVPEIMKFDTVIEDADTRVQKYLLTVKNESVPYDSIYVFYNRKALGVPYSFSLKLDTSSVFKLCKYSIVSMPFFSDRYKMNVPRREIGFEMIKQNNASKEESNYFNSYVNRAKSFK